MFIYIHFKCDNEVHLCQLYLLSSTRLPLEDRLCCLIVLVRHGAGEGGHSLAVTDVETNVRMGNEELYNDVVLVANGSMDGSPALCILTNGHIKHVYSSLSHLLLAVFCSGVKKTDLCVNISSKL